MKLNTLKSLYTCLLLVVLASLAACKGDDAKPATRTQMITKNWKVQQVEETLNGTSNIIYQQGTAGSSVDYSVYRLNFTSASNFTRTNRDNTTISGTWNFDSSETIITFDPKNPETVTIEELRDNLLIITYPETDAKGRTRDIRMQLIPA